MGKPMTAPDSHEPQPGLERKIKITNKLGLHARPAALLVQTANKFVCDVEIRKGRQKVNGKSIMGIMTLAAEAGSQIMIRTCGKDEKEAMDALEQLFATNFGEE